jgi:hypothetical protein
MFGAEFIASGSADFELSGHERTQKFGVLVVDMADIFFTKFTVHDFGEGFRT